MEFWNIFKELCELPGISGREDAVREAIISHLPDDVSFETDPLGSVIVEKRGKITPKHSILFTAHMDEVGFIITSIDEDGSLRFSTVGGIDPHTIAGRQVKIGENIGVVGLKPIHLQKEKERQTPLSVDDLRIDIGAENRKQAEKFVKVGDSAVFVGELHKFGQNRVMGKAIDDRFGCALLLKHLHEETEYSFTAAFLVQEEVGLRGAKSVAFTVSPDIAIVLETTTAADFSDVPTHRQTCKLANGPVIPFMDNRTIYDKELYKAAFEVADKEGIACQTKTTVAGGNDAGAIASSGSGVRTLAISLPCRNLHSARTVADLVDMEKTRKLITAFGRRIAGLQ